MPLLKRKKVTSLPVPAALASLPDPAEQQRFLESVLDEDAQLASGSSSHGPTSARQESKVNGTSARPYGNPWNDEHDRVATTRTGEFEGVVLDSFHGKAAYHGSSSRSENKPWQPLKDSERLLPSRPSSCMDMDEAEDALITPENADDKLLGTLLVLKQKQADLLAVQRRTRSLPDVATRPRSGRKTDGTMHEAHAGANGNEAVYEEMDDLRRYDAAKVPLQLGKWVEPEVYVIVKTGEIFETYE